MPKIRPGQLRARPASWLEHRLDLLRGAPRSLTELRQSLLMLGMYRQIGWHRSVRAGLPVDVDGEALPWFSYPALQWLASVLRGSEHVFEYGCGNSTVWFSRHVAAVVSVEHDDNWIRQQRTRVGGNVEFIHRTCSGDEDWASGDDPYVDALAGYPTGRFDLVIVDGMARNSCVHAAINHLPDAGMIILDNADRPAHYPGVDALHQAGFGRIDFVGPTVVQGVFSSTSVFARHLPAGVASSGGHPTFWGY